MPTPLRRRLRMARRGLGYVVAIGLVLVAMVLAVANQLLPLAERNPERVAAWLSERSGRPIAFDAVQTEWTRRGPLLQLENLRVGEGEGAFTVGDTEMLVSVYAGLFPGIPLSELRLRGLDLTLERLPDGRWQVRGLPGQEQSGGDPFAALEGLGELQVIDGRLSVVAPAMDIDATIPRIDLRLRVEEETVRAGLRAWPTPHPHAGASPLDASLELDRTSGDGRVHAGAPQVDLAQWSSLLRLMGVAVDAGKGRAEGWARLHGNRVDQVAVDAALDAVTLVGASADGAGNGKQVVLARVAGRAQWQRMPGGWRLDAPSIQITDEAGQHEVGDLLLATGETMAVLAERVDAGPLARVAALSDRLHPALRRWIEQADPRASLHDIHVTGQRDGPLSASARVTGLGFDPVAGRPGLDGIAASVAGDATGFSAELDGDSAVRVHWPVAFGQDHVARLDGTISGWRGDDGWSVGSRALRVTSGDVGIDARGHLRWQGDGSRPWMELAATVDDTDLPVARQFWLRHLMSDALIEWLDTALVAGRLEDGRALVSGDLDEWPFEGDDGRFEASAHISGATVRYHPDWAPAEQVEADTRFIGNGFDITGTASVAGIAVDRVEAGLDSYRGGTLKVRASGDTGVGPLFDLLRTSPLHALQPETFDSIQGSGPARASFGLDMPLRGRGPLSIAGTVQLQNARLSDPRWDLSFQGVTGQVAYSSNGFSAEGLRVRHQGRPGRLSMRAGEGHVNAEANVFEAELDASLGVEALADRAPQLDWLSAHVAGRSDWNVAVTVPKGGSAADGGARLRMRSDLTGTTLRLPAPLDKAAATALETTVDAPLPLESGELRVGLGHLMALRARSGNGRTGVRIEAGSNRVAEAPPSSGLIATGRAARLDALEWLGLVQGGDGAGDFPLRRVDITAGGLRLLGSTFPDTRVRVAPDASGGMVVTATGASLDGRLRVPEAEGGPISGRFARLHWRSTREGTAPAGPTATGATAPAPDDGMDPARIPSLSIDVDDLKVADAALGRGTIRTRQTPAGLQLVQLATRGDGEAIDATGSWTGADSAARTKMVADVTSDDFGKLMSELGLGNRLAHGEGRLHLSAGWPGSPAAFQPARLDGELEIDVRDGTLIEVEPGAGRVLGLLSLAELPRRLSLDFGDFFQKGFAFNRLDGNIRFEDGRARSENLTIEGPAAEINIRGAADLRNATFDQTIEVLPRTGNLLTAVGAIAGGPVGAALGAAANAVLQKPLGQMAAKTYRVTGPWGAPEVEVVGRDQGRAATPSPPPAG